MDRLRLDDQGRLPFAAGGGYEVRASNILNKYYAELIRGWAGQGTSDRSGTIGGKAWMSRRPSWRLSSSPVFLAKRPEHQLVAPLAT
jgi:hypothetical protein